MALPADFNKIYGSAATGGLTPISDVNYAKGWEFVGSTPPTKNDFSYLQNLSDLKSQWLYSNKLQRTNPFGDIKSDGTVQAALGNLGLLDLVLAGVAGGSLGATGYAEIPLVISGAKKNLLLCWGIGATGSDGSFTQSFAKAFPTEVLCKLVTNQASTTPSGFAGARTTLSTITIYSSTAAGTPSSSGVAYNYLAIGY